MVVWDGLGRPTPPSSFSPRRFVTTAMNIPPTMLTTFDIRRLLLLAATLLVAFCASVGLAPRAFAATPPTVPTAPSPTATTAAGTTSTTATIQPSASAPSEPQISESWALTPAASADPDVAGNRSEFAYVADPGTVIKDAVTVLNLGNVPQDFRIYATDAFSNDQGQFDLFTGDQKPVGAGSWVSSPQERVTVPAGKQATIPITITIPLDAPAGDHAGAIVASSPTSGSDTAGNTVQLDRRTGSRLYIRVNGRLKADLAVTDVQTTYDKSINPFGGTAHVRYHVENRGNVRLGGTVKVSIAGPFGLGDTTMTMPAMPELLPGGSVTLTADVGGAPELMVGVATVHLVPTASAGVDTQKSEGKDTSFVPPVPLLLALLVVLVGLMGWRAVRRRRTGPANTSGGTDVQSHLLLELESQTR
jgi:hypothetical protein